MSERVARWFRKVDDRYSGFDVVDADGDKIGLWIPPT